MNTTSNVLFFGVLLASSKLAGQPNLEPPRYVEGELLVKFREGPNGDAAKRVKNASKHEVKRDFDFIGWQQIRLPAGTTVEEALARYRGLPDVLEVEPNLVHEHARGSGGDAPLDPLFRQQWAPERVGAPVAWAATKAMTNIVVAILDTGINYNHEDLRDSMWRNPGEIPGNGIDDDGNGYVDDVYGIDTANDAFGNDSNPIDQGINVSPGGLRIYHGTACAGIAAAAHNGVGLAGIGDAVKIMALRILQVGDTIEAADTLEALNYIILMKRRGVNIRVTSMSYGGGSFSQAEKDGLDAVSREGILQVNGVHNDSLNLDAMPSYPASYSASNLLKVAASEGFDNLASFSNYGRNSVHLAAPGVAMVTTHAPGTNDYFLSFNGTSSACPLAAGAAALLWSRFPNATVNEIFQALLASVDAVPALSNRVSTSGRLNVARAMYWFISNAPPVVITQPQAASVPPGSAVMLRPSVAGSISLVYQWHFNGDEIPGETNAFLSLPSVTTSSAGAYFLIASNGFGAVTSAVIIVRVAPEPVTFTRITNGAIVTTSANAVSASWMDYNNDGWLDLFVATGFSDAPDFLYRNNSNGTFTAISSGGVGINAADSWAGAWGDYDNDGDLDLFVANGGNGGSANDFLYRNDDGVFARVTSAVTTNGGASLDAAWLDFDNDGWLDLYVSNGRLDGLRTNFLYRNNGNGTFARITNGPPVTDSGRYFGLAVGDYDKDGFMDLFVATGQSSPNALYHNNRDGTLTRSTALDAVTDPAFTAGAAWGDFDNDGDLDLVLARHAHCSLLRNEGNGLFTRMETDQVVTDVGDADSATCVDYDNDGYLDLFITSESGVSRLYHNNGDGSFRRVTTGNVANVVGTVLSSTWSDYDKDGFQDLFVCNIGAPSFLYQNDENSNHWLRVQCHGTLSNRDGVGAKVRVKAILGGAECWQMREIAKGNSFGQQEVAASFGLGDASIVDTLRIEWPSGVVQERTNVAANQFLTITEPGLRIVRPPLDVTVQLGNGTNFSVSAISDQPVNALTYQWLFNGVALSGQTFATLSINNAQLSHEGNYCVVVGDGLNTATSQVARLVVLITPTILRPPLSQSVVGGGDVTVSVAVSGHPAPFGYLWRRGSSNLVFLVRDETNCFFTLTNVQMNQGGLHRVVITNAASPTLTINASFMLTVLADDDHDGLPDAWEAQFGVTDAPLDSDHDGFTNLQEYRAGTDPINALSHLNFETMTLLNQASAVRLTFLAMSNLTYTVQSRRAVDTGVWARVADVIATPTNRVLEVIDVVAPSGDTQRFYRLVTPRAPE